MVKEDERIPVSGKGVIVLTGPASSGKTSAVIELYRRCDDAISGPGCLLIVPNAPAVAQAKSLLLERTAGALIAPAVTTFAGLAGNILASSGRSPATLSRVQRMLLLERIIAEIHAAGGFRALGPLVDTPGLAEVLDKSIAELKRAAVEPDMLEKAMGKPSGKDADLLAVYRKYQKHLLDTGLFDVEGQMWQARDVLAGDNDTPLGYEGITSVAVDGFTDFTPTQLEMLALLGKRMKTVLITLPLIDRKHRSRLWFWTSRTLERLHKAMPDARIVNTDNEHEPLRTLFDLTGESEEEPTKREGFSITVLEAPDVEAEVRAVARAVKADLVAGAKSGTIAVVARNMEAYTEPIERIFAAHSIGVRAKSANLDACGPVRYILSLLALRREYEFHDVLTVIKNSYFRPSALGDFDAATVATAEISIRTANVLGGRDSYAKAFARLARRANHAADSDAEDIKKAADMVETLMTCLDELSSTKDITQYVSVVRAIIERLEISVASASYDDDSLVAADLRAMRAFDELLDDVSAAGPLAGEPTDIPARAAAVSACPSARTHADVAVMDVLDARAVRFKHLYLLGVNEKTFPQLTFESCFITESDRTAWGQAGVVLDKRSDLIGREMLLFYLSATRADETLNVSYLAGDAGEGSAARGVFVAELIASARRDRIAVAEKRISPGQFVPPIDQIATPPDAFNAAISAAFNGDDNAHKLMDFSKRNYGDILRRASFGLLAAHRRWAQSPPDEFDGRINSPTLLKNLAEQIPQQWVFSASELNSYAACGWGFFARYLLRLAPLAAPSAQLAPADRGIFCHAVLWRVMTNLAKNSDGVNLAEIDPDELSRTLKQACLAEKNRLADRAIYSQLWDAQTAYWQRLLWNYLSDQREAFGKKPAQSLHFELGFGVTRYRDEDTDSASKPEPIELDAGEYQIRLAGKIDRVDLITCEDAPATLAVDYKTGQLPAARDIIAGRDLQLALYAKALEAMFDIPCAGGAYHDLRNNKHRYFATFKTPKAEEGYAELLAGAMEAVGLYVGAMREGRFDAIPAGKCSKWCPYRQICQYSQARANRKVSF